MKTLHFLGFAYKISKCSAASICSQYVPICPQVWNLYAKITRSSLIFPVCCSIGHLFPLIFLNVRQTVGSVWNVFFFFQAPHTGRNILAALSLPVCSIYVLDAAVGLPRTIMLNLILMFWLSFSYQVCLPARPGSGPRHRPGSDGLTCQARQGLFSEFLKNVNIDASNLGTSRKYLFWPKVLFCLIFKSCSFWSVGHRCARLVLKEWLFEILWSQGILSVLTLIGVGVRPPDHFLCWLKVTVWCKHFFFFERKFQDKDLEAPCRENIWLSR